MTRKDFSLLAEVIANLSFDEDVRAGIAEDFANALAQTNPRFNKDRFIAACNGKGGR